MYSLSGGDALAVPKGRESVLLDHSSVGARDKQAFGREKFDRERYPSKRDWPSETRSSSYRSSGVLADGSLTANFCKRRVTGRHETVMENGRHRSVVGVRSSKSCISLQSPSETGKADRDARGMERLSGDADGHRFRDVHFFSGDVRSHSSPHFDSSSRPHGNHNDTEDSGSWDRGSSRFSSPPYGWDAPNKGRDSKERAWNRPDYRRVCPLPKLDSLREWSQSDRELLEGRIDRYSSVSGRDPAFQDILSTRNKEKSWHEWRGRDRAVHIRMSSRSSPYPPANNIYLRDSKTTTVEPDVLGTILTPPHSPVHSSLSHDSDQDEGRASFKKRPRLTWGQGLAKYEKEKTGEDLSAVKRSEEGTNYAGGLHSDGSVASGLRELSSQMGNGCLSLDNIHPCKEQIPLSDPCANGNMDLSLQDSIAYSSAEASFREGFTHRNIDGSPNPDCGHRGSVEIAIPGTSASRTSVLQFMQAFLRSYQKELPTLSKDILTQYVEKVEFEIDKLEKEIVRLEREHIKHYLPAERESIETHLNSTLNSVVESELPSSPSPLCEGSQALAYSPSVKVSFVDRCDNGGLESLDVLVHAQESLKEIETTEQVVDNAIDRDECGSNDRSVVDAAQGGFSPAQAVNTRVGNESEKLDGSRNFVEVCQDSIGALLLSNQTIAEESLRALAHLNASATERVLHAGGLYDGPQETSLWKQNADAHARKRKFLKCTIAEEKKLVKFVERVLASRYRAKREAWKQQQSSKCEPGKKSGIASPSLHSPLPPTLSTVSDANIEEVQVIEKLLVQSAVDVERGYLRMPSMVLGQKERAFHRFETKNALVEDPVTAEQERKVMNPWSAEERKIFLEKYLLYGKNLRKIASFLEHKSIADCVQFFYQNQKTEEFEKISSRHQLKKWRDSRSSALYLSTTTSVSSRHREENAAFVGGLTLVADAAAAMSAPRDLSRSMRSLATKSYSFKDTNSKTCRSANLIKQGSSTSVLTGKDSNGEQMGAKYARNMHSRSLKRPLDGDSQWNLHWAPHWSDQERDLFVNAVTMFGKNFDSISSHIGTKTQGQCKAYFSKARKRLGLDQLVERHKAMLLDAGEQNSLANQSNGVDVRSHVNLESGFKTEGELSEHQLRMGRSLLCANSSLASEAHFDSSREIHDLAALCTSKSLQDADRCDSAMPGGNAICKLQAVENPVKQEVNTNMNGQACIPSQCAANGCITNEVYEDTLQVNMEPIVSNVFNGVPNGTFSCVHSINTPLMVSGILPSSLPTTATLQAAQSKDKSLKTTDCKARREPTSWTQAEKETFVDILKVHGKNWDLLNQSLPAKSLTQIKTFFQNSKAKLGLGSEGVVSNNGKAAALWRRKVDDSDSSSNAGRGGQVLPQKVPALLDDGSLKVNPSIVVPSGGAGSNVLAAEALAYANLFGRNLLEDSINAQKAFQAMALAPNSPAPVILPMFNSAVCSPSNLLSSQPLHVHNASASTKMMEPSSTLEMQQVHQQPAIGTCQDVSLPAVQPLNKHAVQKLNQNTLLPPPTQQLQQVAEAVLQQLLPQAVPRHLQQQLAAQQVPHHLLSQGLNQVVSLQAGIAAAGQQTQQQAGFLQSQLHEMHGKLQALLQQHQQVPQLQHLQFLQLQRQQQFQAQQIQAQHIPNQTPPLLQQNHNLSNEQHHLAFLRGMPLVSNASNGGPTSNDLDFYGLCKSQQGTHEDALTVHQSTGAPSNNQAIDSQFSAGDVKLFGQSLLSQPDQHSSGKICSASSSPGASFATSTDGITGKMNSNMSSKVPWDYVMQGQECQLNMQPSASVSNGRLSITATSDTGAGEMGSSSVQEAVSCQNERPIKDVSNNHDGRGNDIAVSTVLATSLDHLSLSSTLSLPCGQAGELKRFEKGVDRDRAGQVINFDQGVTLNSSKDQEFQPDSASGGGQVVVSQGLPRVLNALVALAEWRLQNSNGSSGKLTDEFLSQSWEALQKDPGSLIEAGKASGPLAQMCSGGPDMLQHLRERLLSSQLALTPPHPGSAGGAAPGSSSAVHSNHVPSPSTSLQAHDGEHKPVSYDELGTLEARDVDGSGGVVG